MSVKRLFLFLLLSLLTASAAHCDVLPALPVLPDGNTLTYTLTDDVHLLQQYADALCPGYTVVGGKADYISLMLIADSLEGEVIAEFDHETDALVLGTDEEWAHVWLPGNDCFSGFIPIGAVMAE